MTRPPALVHWPETVRVQVAPDDHPVIGVNVQVDMPTDTLPDTTVLPHCAVNTELPATSVAEPADTATWPIAFNATFVAPAAGVVIAMPTTGAGVHAG